MGDALNDRWAHQPIAVAAIEDALRRGGRATVESGCGTGKSRIAARAAGRLAATGRVLVTVPTLELVGQMLQTFARHGGVGLGRVVAVCSDAEVVAARDLELDSEGAAVTTDPAQLAALTRARGRVTVLCTYQSLDVLAAAHARHRLPAWDLAVIDEAHRTAGRAGKSWSLIHDDVMVPAVRRLYMTATRKILGSSGEDAVVSMDDEKVFGPVVFRLSTAEGIRRGLLADYQVLVVVVSDAQVRELTEAEDQHLRVGTRAVSPRVLAMQIAVLRAAAQYGVRRAITFHNRVADARAWAELLPHAWQMMPPTARPATVTAHHVYGGQPVAERRAALDHLQLDEQAGQTGLRVVCNARVLTEGVDAPAVDAIVLVDPRNSVIDTVQAVGRALRTGGRSDKIARIIVPVFLGPDEDPESALEGSAYAQVWQVIRALRAHDDRLATRLDVVRTRLGETHVCAATGETVLDDPGDWLQVWGAPVPAGFTTAIQLRAVEASSSSWMEFYGAARRFFAEHGHLDLPVNARTPDGLQLGQWLRNQRRHRESLPAERVAMLDRIGMIWQREQDATWKKGIAAARAYAAAHGGSLHDIPNAWSHDGVRLSPWLVTRRQDLQNGRLSAKRKAALDAIDPTWSNSDAVWEQRYEAARKFFAEHGHLRPDPEYRTSDGLDLARWLDSQRARLRSKDLRPDRKARLDAIGMVWSELQQNWQRGLAAAAAHAKTHGNLDVPVEFVTTDGFPLGRWLHTRRRQVAAGRLPAERRSALDALDANWHAARTRSDTWTTHYEAARAYAQQHGRLPRGRGAAKDPAPQGLDFRRWLVQQRQDARRGVLKPQRRALLDALDPHWRGEAHRPGQPTTTTPLPDRPNNADQTDRRLL